MMLTYNEAKQKKLAIEYCNFGGMQKSIAADVFKYTQQNIAYLEGALEQLISSYAFGSIIRFAILASRKEYNMEKLNKKLIDFGLIEVTTCKYVKGEETIETFKDSSVHHILNGNWLTDYESYTLKSTRGNLKYCWLDSIDDPMGEFLVEYIKSNLIYIRSSLESCSSWQTFGNLIRFLMLSEHEDYNMEILNKKLEDLKLAQLINFTSNITSAHTCEYLQGFELSNTWNTLEQENSNVN